MMTGKTSPQHLEASVENPNPHYTSDTGVTEHGAYLEDGIQVDMGGKAEGDRTVLKTAKDGHVCAPWAAVPNVSQCLGQEEY